MTRDETLVVRGYSRRLLVRLNLAIPFRVKLLLMEIAIIITVTKKLIVLIADVVHTRDMRRVPLFLINLL